MTEAEGKKPKNKLRVLVYRDVPKSVRFAFMVLCRLRLYVLVKMHSKPKLQVDSMPRGA